jgi:hypothetical protein
MGRIFTDVLGIYKIFYRWVPHLLTPALREKRVEMAQQMLSILKRDRRHNFVHVITGDETWVFYNIPYDFEFGPLGSPRPVVEKKELTKDKVMLIVFWSVEGFHVIEPLPPNTTCTADFFQKRVIKPLNKIFKPKTAGHPIWFHCDNCAVHRAKTSHKLLSDYEFVEMPHPPYSPDLAPSDFFLFGTVKERLKGLAAHDAEKTQSSFVDELKVFTQEDLISVMLDWMDRLEECIATEGDLVEKRGSRK